MRRFALLLPAVTALACGGGRATNPSSPDDFVATTWRLQTLERTGASAVTVTTPDRYTLRLEPSSGRASVRADCNGCGGAFTLDGDQLTLPLMACTLVGCPADSLDGAYLSVLNGKSRLRRSGDTLTLASDGGRLTFSR
jgi:heat shock protein HslJ